MAANSFTQTLSAWLQTACAWTKAHKPAAYGIGAAAVVALGAVAYFVFGNGGLGLSNRVAVEIKQNDMVLGDPSAPNVMVEYGSLTCSHCMRMNDEVISKVIENYVKTGKVRYVFRDWPTDGYARMAAALAHCLSGDNYFAFVDLLYKNQGQWTLNYGQNGKLTVETGTDELAVMARFAGMSREKAVSCINDPANLAIVDGNQTEGTKLYGVNSTPSFVINNYVYVGEQSYETLQKLFDK